MIIFLLYIYICIYIYIYLYISILINHTYDFAREFGPPQTTPDHFRANKLNKHTYKNTPDAVPRTLHALN